MRGRIVDYPEKRPRLDDDKGRKWRKHDRRRHQREKQGSRREWEYDSSRRDHRNEEQWQERSHSRSHSHSNGHEHAYTEDSRRDRPEHGDAIRRDREHVKRERPHEEALRMTGETELGHEDGASVRAKLKQAIIEQDQAFVRLVEERRCQVRRLEEQSRDVERQLVEAQRKLIEAEIQLKKLRERNDLDDSLNECQGHHLDPSSNHKGTVPAEAHCFHAPSNGKGKTPSKVEHVKVKVEPQDYTDLQRKHEVAPESNPIIHTGNKYETEKLFHKDHRAERGRSDSGSSSVINTCLESEMSLNMVEHVGSYMEPAILNVLSHHYSPIQHKRRPRCLIVNPNSVSEQILATSALDGHINLWKLQDDGERISLHQSVQCLSSGQRRWPESITWHPSGDSLFACYSADGNDEQVAIISPSSKDKVTFLTAKPHDKGLINSLVFLPWNEGSFFATGGCDHCVVLWKEEPCGNWKSEVLHRSLHTAAVMSASGMQDKPLIVSVGMDKKIIGYDTNQGKEIFRYVLDMKALDMLPNPIDKNLYMVQTRAPGHQLRLFDVRANYSQIHVLGWNQESTETQSAHISQSWSPDGYFIASGSADPKVHIFDIRYNSKEPTQSINAHQRRVFKAVWHPKLPLLVSVSSDLQIGLIKLSSGGK